MTSRLCSTALSCSRWDGPSRIVAPEASSCDFDANQLGFAPANAARITLDPTNAIT